jgi:hypothetical protein
MKTSAAVFAGACLVAATVFAQPSAKERSVKAPAAVKSQASAEKVITRMSPIEGFALRNIHAFEVGELKTSCVIDRRGRELTMKTTVLPAEPGAYGGCCFEHTEALPLDAGVTVAASLSSSRSEEMVHVAVEQSSGMSQLLLHRGRLEAGPHELVASSSSLSEVRRLCVAVYSGSEAPHETSLKITRVTFDAQAPVKPISTALSR